MHHTIDVQDFHVLPDYDLGYMKFPSEFGDEHAAVTFEDRENGAMASFFEHAP